jgi:ATP-dependent DNA helicase RecQ
MAASPASWSLDALRKVVSRHWGFEGFRPLQQPAMRAVLQGRDSVVVMPTGGGKSLCYQAPAVLRGDTTVVVSPLIALMKDQVDGLQACGVPAVQIDSSQGPEERSACEREVARGAVRLLFVSPERLVLPGFQRLLERLRVRTFAIDEAHCISHWGHDFRPEYRQLDRLKDLFPGASVHAYTATATERVRQDIIDQLRLQDPEVLVGDFDRPNLTYRVLARTDLKRQVFEALDRHRGEAGIVYCIRRREVDDLTATLRKLGFRASPYHAGLSAEERRATQDAFRAEGCDVVVATVAFGMGIDRSNIRYVLHTGMPKSLEHYQQETGRAGRDGLEAECVLLHSGADFFTWKSILERSAGEPGVDPAFLPGALQHLDDMDRYCRGAVCRHRALVQYFGQPYQPASCGACDLCLGDTETVPDARVVAQKILSCVARLKERFGIVHTVSVLRGENTEAVRKRGHDRLSTYGLLRDHPKADIREWVYQLIGQGVLLQEGDEYPLLRLNAASWEVMRGQREVRLLQPVRRKRVKESKADTGSWDGVDRTLFELLRGVRSRLAAERGVPPYVIFSDATLRALSRTRPSSLEGMRLVYGIGDAKLRDFGPQFHQVIVDYCRDHRVTADVPGAPADPAPPGPEAPPGTRPRRAFELFREGAAVEDVMHQLGRARATVVDYLCDFIRRERPASVTTWVPEAAYHQIAGAARRVGTERLKPIFVALGGRFGYDEIRLVVTHLMSRADLPPGLPGTG